MSRFITNIHSLRRIATLLMGLWLFCACQQEKKLSIRTEFFEDCAEFMLSDDPDLFDCFDYVLCLEYPTSIVSAKGVSHEQLCQSIQRDLLEQIFGEENTQSAYDGLLPDSPHLQESEDNFVSLAKNLSWNRNLKIKEEYEKRFGIRTHGGEKDIVPEDLTHMYEIHAFLSYNYKEVVSYHIHWKENQYGQKEEYERGYNYGLNGQLLYEKDLFKEDWMDEVPHLLTTEFEQFPLTASIQLHETPIKPNGNFKLSPKGIIYMFDKGEIADAKYGILRITIPWDKINFLK